MMNKPAITVAVPFYNEEKYLRECIESVRKQSYPNWQLLLVDDGSTDRSPVICQEYTTDPRIRYYRQPHSGSSGATRNACLQLVDTDYLTFLDGDDQLGPDFLTLLYQRMVKDDSDIVVSYFHGILSNGDYVHYDDSAMVGLDLDRAYSPREWFTTVFPHIKGEFWTSWGKLFKTTIFEHLRFRTDVVAEDVHTVWKTYFNAKRISFCKVNQYQYAIHDNSLSRRTPYTLSHPYQYGEEIIAMLKLVGIPTHDFADQYLNDMLNVNYQALEDNDLIIDTDSRYKIPILLKALKWKADKTK